jgi:hypothetical protein
VFKPHVAKQSVKLCRAGRGGDLMRPMVMQPVRVAGWRIHEQTKS